ncbi:LacI family DNA-binding transcriptional regulator [uncultured Martelella sp.]|uniref:LacI family DNA-binding transcriptional regulator n=1 Tax=uncultured Martelella sp. TaxID=392331 RepID=UPI0029C7A8C0|nr:LacI family DNA-binding transcriptional regulator [uncultured Martelella sp.]
MGEVENSKAPSSPKKPTLADVARLSGVAPVTVSRVLNTPDQVKEKTRLRVMEAVNSLQYQINVAARVLAGSKWGAVGVVVPSLDHPMIARQVRVFEAEMQVRDISLLISASNYDAETEAKALRKLVSRGVDGILITHLEEAEFALPFLAQNDVPTVSIGSRSQILTPNWIAYDDFGGMESIVDHLHTLGHGRIGLIGDRRAVRNGQGRIDAIVKRAAERGLDLSSERIHRCGADETEAFDAFRTLLATNPRPSAIICGNDNLALACMAEARRLGVRIPEDVSLTGFDDLQVSSHPLISLTTVRPPWQELGSVAAEAMLAGIAGGEPQQRLMPTEIVCRESTAKPHA